MLQRGLKPRRTGLLLRGTRVKAVRSLGEGFHRLFPCRLWASSSTIAVTFSIRTASFQPLVFCSSLARFLQAVYGGR